MKTYEETLREVRLTAVMCGAIAFIDGKELLGKNGYWYLDGELVEDVDALLEKVQVNEEYVREQMNK